MNGGSAGPQRARWRRLTAGVPGVLPLRPCLIAILVLAATCASASLAYADEPPTRDAYRAIIAEALALVERAEKETLIEPRRPLLSEAAGKLAAVREVQWDGATRLPVNNGELASVLGAAADSTDKVRAARARLQALHAALGAPSPPAASAGEYARLAEMLGKPPFRDAPAPGDWLWAQIAQWLDSLLGGTVRGAFELRYAIMAIGILLIVSVVAYFLLSLRRNAVAESSLLGAPDAGENPTSAQALAGAQRSAAAGDLRTAVRLLYLSTLLWLDEHGHLRYDRSLTNREYLRAVGGTPAVREALAPLVETFDRIWYGVAPVSDAEFERYRRAVDAVRRL